MSRLRPRHGGRPLSRLALNQWLQAPRAQSLIELERCEVSRLLPEVFGRHVLQIGSWGQGDDLLQASETLHRAVLGTVTDVGASALIESERLPVASSVVDAVLLPHTLEFSPSPHHVLREVNRILTDRGRLFVLGFNPWSLWGLRQRFGLRDRAFPGGARFYSAGRLCDWLELLDLEVIEVRRYGLGFPWTTARSDGDGWNFSALAAPWSEAYLLAARKRVIPMRLVGRVARAHVRPLIGIGAPAAGRGEGRACLDSEPSPSPPPSMG